MWMKPLLASLVLFVPPPAAVTPDERTTPRTPPACAVSSQVGVLYCVWRLENGQLRYTGMPPQDLPAAPLGPYAQAADLPPLPGGAGGDPQVVHLVSGRLAVLIRGSDGTLRRVTYQPNQGRWFAWADTGLTLAPGIQPSCVAVGERPLCYLPGPDGAPTAHLLEAEGPD
jgi:hypothetical protein